MRTTRTEIATHWFCDLHMDMGEACCWGCGLWDGSEGDDAYENADWLERCHLIPESLGGADAPENLVLLCQRCHIEMPNVGDRASTLDWVRGHRERVARRLMAEVQRLCPDANERLKRRDPAAFSAAWERRSDEAIVHWGEGLVNDATLAWIYAQALIDATEPSEERAETALV